METYFCVVSDLGCESGVDRMHREDAGRLEGRTIPATSTILWEPQERQRQPEHRPDHPRVSDHNELGRIVGKPHFPDRIEVVVDCLEEAT